MKRFVSLLLICLMIVGFSFPAAAKNGVPENREDPAARYEETAQALRDAGIVLPEETVTETKTWIEERGLNPAFFASCLLSRVGWGVYDYDTYSWTPTSSDVYAFDAEIVDYTRMYELFFQGITAIVPGFEAADVNEVIEPWAPDDNPPDFVPGVRSEGITKVGFTMNGRRYERELLSWSDWFNEDAIDWINEALEAEGFPGRLYSFPDAGQGLILIYGGPEKAEAVRRALGQ